MSRARWLAPLLLAGLLLGGLLLAAGPAAARTLLVGPDQKLTRPSQAAAMAQDGDTVLIAPGAYYDCAQWRANDLTIAASGPGVVLTDTACAGKASFVISGADVTVRGITFARIRVADHNGAGIRAEGGNLTVEDCAFVNNQVAILATDRDAAVLRILRSRFSENGACEGKHCTTTLMIGRRHGLEITDSRFLTPRAGVAISSQAGIVTLRGNQFVAAAATGVAQFAVRGPVVIADNTLDQPEGAAPALLLTGGAAPVTLRGNTLRIADDTAGTLLLNWSDAEPAMQANQVLPRGTELSTSGAWVERLRLAAHAVYDPARALAGKVKGKLFELSGRGLGKLRQLLPF